MTSIPYIISDGLRTFRISGSSSLNACKNFFRRLNKCGETAEPVLYVRTGSGGGLENEVWYFTFQFNHLIPHEFSKALIEQQEEPEFLHGGTNRKRRYTPRSKTKNDRYRTKNRSLGLCEICGKKKETLHVECKSCRDRRLKKSRRKRKILKEQEVENNPLGIPKENGIPFDEPTKAQPGSTEKVTILERRYEEGYVLFHPDDSKQMITKQEAIDKRFSDPKTEKPKGINVTKTSLEELSTPQKPKDYL